MASPKISVIVPVYNAQKYLERCLDSLQRQTYSNLEFILVDDGSSDNSLAICKQYAENDMRFRVLHQENAGVSAARNAGLQAATGDWLGFVDSDDYIEPDMYEYLIGLATKYVSDIAQCGLFWDESFHTGIRDVPSCDKSFALQEQIPLELWRYFSNSSNNKIFLRETLPQSGFDNRFVIGEDLLFNLQALNVTERIVFGARAAYHYVQNIDSACHAVINDRTLNSMRNMLLYAENLFSHRISLLQYCRDQRMKNNFDICSKLVCNKETNHYNELKDTIQGELRTLWHTGYSTCTFPFKDRTKALLIGYCWPLYQFLIPLSKRINFFKKE